MTDQQMQAPARVVSGVTERGWVRPVLALFLFSLLIPGSIEVLGGTRLDAHRIVLLILIIPLVIAWMSGQGNRVILPDILIAAHGIWIIVVFLHHHGVERVPYGIITGVEMFGGYLLGRLLIRSAADFERFFIYMIGMMVLLLPFTLFELSTGRAILQEYSQSILGMSYRDIRHQPRTGGLWRVQSVFPHPILFGLFCSIAIANIFFIWRKAITKALGGAGLALFMTFASLSSGPFLAANLQLCLLAWGKVTRNAWWTLAALFFAAYVFLEVASNRGMMLIIIETFTFNPMTGWWRIHINNYGMMNVWANPIFGIGLGDWVRPPWLTWSVDNFWLLLAMRYGIVGFALFVGGLVLLIWRIIRADGLSEQVQCYRTGYMIGLVGLVFSLVTVHVWGSAFVLVMFYFGAGAWFFLSDHRGEQQASELPQAPADTAPMTYRRQHTRTPRHHRAPRTDPVTE